MKRAAMVIILCLAVAGCGSGINGDDIGIGRGAADPLSLLFVEHRDGDTQLYYRVGDDPAKQMTTGETDYFGDVHLSDDGSRIIFARSVDNEVGIYSMTPGDAGPTLIVYPVLLATSNRSHHSIDVVNEYDVTADGSAVVFVTTSTDGSAYSSGATEIHTIAFDGSGHQLLVDTGDEDDLVGLPQFSPDGERIAYWRLGNNDRPSGLYVMDRDGRGVRMVASSKEMNHEGFEYLSWSPDGRKIAVVNADQDALYVVNVDGGGGAEEIIRTPETEGFDYLGNPAFSPDGKWIAYHRSAMNAPGQVFTDPAQALSGSSAEIFMIPVDGGAARQVTDEGQQMEAADDPVFTPDGSTLVFVGGPMDPKTIDQQNPLKDFGIYRVAIDGSGVRKLHSGRADQFDIALRTG
ncbi:hypothetical protein [Nocardia sp. NPDC057353]|uniref:hypothetical protein n=1 Tax=Nocardia sp. NPDC057353 TaxID=3346104 RepID=UPI00363CA54C